MLVLKNYQEKAVEDVIKITERFFEADKGQKICYLQAPTGSGKTIIAQAFIDRIQSKYPESNLCFLWVSPGKGNLHIQSYNSVKKIISNKFKCSLFEDEVTGQKNVLSQNEILFLSWPRINKKNKETGKYLNTAMREGENTNFLQILNNTKKLKRKIILIIDESHYGQNSERTQELLLEFSAEITIAISATPEKEISELDRQLNLIDGVQIIPSQVVEEGMIKKSILLNYELDEFNKEDSFRNTMRAGLARRHRLQQKYVLENSSVKPICLIQLPNGQVSVDLLEDIKTFLISDGITEDNDQLVIYLDKYKTKGVDIHNLLDTVKVVVFKQGLDLGWDCPQASVLIRLRDIKSEAFNFQTLGRVSRMPERKHYNDDELNYAYLYTDKDKDDIEISMDVFSKFLIFKEEHLLKLCYENFIPMNYYIRKRVGRNRIDKVVEFYSLFRDIFCKRFDLNKYDDKIEDRPLNLQKIINQDFDMNRFKVDRNIPLNYKIDLTEGLEHNIGYVGGSEFVTSNISDKYIHYIFIDKIRENLSGLAPSDSIKAVKRCIYRLFENMLGLENPIEVQRVFINEDIFQIILQKTTEIYAEKQALKRDKILKVDNRSWLPPKILRFNEEMSTKYNYKKYTYKPCYIYDKNRSSVETNLEKEIFEVVPSIISWLKNDVEREFNFGIKYTDNNNNEFIFYPDYILKHENGKQFILEAKDGFTTENAKYRAEALNKYISSNKNLDGGIVIKHNNRWRINRKENYNYDLNNMSSNWEYLEDVIG